jgi:hypothetical protein
VTTGQVFAPACLYASDESWAVIVRTAADDAWKVYVRCGTGPASEAQARQIAAALNAQQIAAIDTAGGAR